MNEQKLRIGDTLVFDHSDYSDYCIVYAVSDDGRKGRMACVDDGGGTDCLWLFFVEYDENGRLVTYQNRTVRRDPDMMERALDRFNPDEDGIHFETLLIHLVEAAAYNPDSVTFFPDDDNGMVLDDELLAIREGFPVILENNALFRAKYKGGDLSSISIPKGNKVVWKTILGQEVLALVDVNGKPNKKAKEPAKPEPEDNRPVMERITTIEDACRDLNRRAEAGDETAATLLADYESNADNIMTKATLAYMMLNIIAYALNEGWEPQFTVNEYRWFPHFFLYTQKEIDDMNEEERKKVHIVGGSADHFVRCAVSYSSMNRAFSNSNAFLAARLAFKTSELAKYAGTQFIEIWSDYCFKPKRDE